jgi:uncharacterized protein
MMAGLQLAVILATALPWYAPSSAGVVTKDVTFSNKGATLHGTLYLPVANHPVPAVVVYQGAEVPLASTPLYKHLSQGLPQLGVAVLLFDRRGSGASSGSNDVPYETLTDDGIAGANVLRAMPQIDAARVGYWGISQGGWLATFAAIRDPHAAFAIAVSAPLTTPEVQMEFADANHLYALGYTRADIDSMLEARKMWTGYLRGTNSRAQAVAAIAKIENKPWYQYMYMPTSAELKGPDQSTWVTQMDDDPLSAVKKIAIPMLFILASNDPWIPVKQTEAALREVTATHPKMSYVVIPDVNHLMMRPPDPERMEDASPQALKVEVPDSAAYLMVLSSWLTRVLGLN